MKLDELERQNSLQWVKHAWLYYDLLSGAGEREPSIQLRALSRCVLNFCVRAPHNGAIETHKRTETDVVKQTRDTEGRGRGFGVEVLFHQGITWKLPSLVWFFFLNAVSKSRKHGH